MEAMKAEKRKMGFMKNVYTRIIYKMKQNTVNQKTLFVNTVKVKNTLDLKRCMELVIKNNMFTLCFLATPRNQSISLRICKKIHFSISGNSSEYGS